MNFDRLELILEVSVSECRRRRRAGAFLIDIYHYIYAEIYLEMGEQVQVTRELSPFSF